MVGTVYGGNMVLDCQHGTQARIQVTNVLNLLRKNQNSRRAVIQLFGAADIARKRQHIPCTCHTAIYDSAETSAYVYQYAIQRCVLGSSSRCVHFTMLQES